MLAKKLTNANMILYAAPTFCLMFLVGPGQSLIQGVYTQHFGLKLADLAGIVLFARVFDAIVDPLIGFLSDRTQATLPGGRKFWVVLGGAVSVIAAYYLLIPKQPVTSSYFFFWFVICYVGWSLIEIPHLSWGSELSVDYTERSRIFSLRAFFFYLGYVAFLALPFLPIFSEPGYTPAVLEVAFKVVLVAFPVTIFLAARYAPQGDTAVAATKVQIFHAVSALRWNQPLRIFVAVFILIGLGIGLQTGIAFLYITSFLGLIKEAPTVLILSFPFAILGLPVWLWASKRFGKHYGLFAGLALTAVTFVGLAMLRPDPKIFWTFLALNATIHFVQGSWISIGPSMLGDIVDYDRLRTGEDNSATYFAFFTFIRKVFEGLGGGLGLMIAARYGFEPSSLTINEDVIFGMQLVIGYLPAIIFVLAAWFALKSPLTRERHSEIVRQLEQAEAKSG